ncbi:MAG: hypothetical protein H6R15_4023 [Proteobacteria bacterium]|nr:hypothetical protein [Pseudomonadota bacterium]
MLGSASLKANYGLFVCQHGRAHGIEADFFPAMQAH